LPSCLFRIAVVAIVIFIVLEQLFCK